MDVNYTEKLEEALKTIYELLGNYGKDMNNEVSSELSINASKNSVDKLTLFNKELTETYALALQIKEKVESLKKYFRDDYIIEPIHEEDKEEIVDSNKDEVEIKEEKTEDEKEISLDLIDEDLSTEDKDNQLEENEKDKDKDKEESNDDIELPSLEESKEEKIAELESSVDKLDITFKKISDEDPKVISVNSEQFEKLQESRSTSEALLFTKGILPKTGDISDVEVKKEPVVPEISTNPEDTKAKLQELSEKATELYKKGEVQEAQKVMDEISALSKSM